MNKAIQANPIPPSLDAAPARGSIMRVVGPVAVSVALLSALTTFVVLADLTPISPTHEVVVGLLSVNALTVLILLAVIARDVWLVLEARRRGLAAARLHVRIVGLFCIIAATPAVLVAVIANVVLDRGIDQQISSRTKAVIGNSVLVADMYLNEQADSVGRNVVGLAFELARAKPLFDFDRERFRQLLTAQANLRKLSAVLLLGADASVIEKVETNNEQKILMPSAEGLALIGDTQPQIGPLPEVNAVGGIIKLRGYIDTWLYVVNTLDPMVVQRLNDTRAIVQDFANLESRRSGVKFAFALMYTVISLTVLLAAAWLGLNFANLLVAPIRRLISAANEVSTGNLNVQVPVRRSEGDLARLGQTFNKMTQELRTQHEDLVRASEVIDQRRRFTEAVLAGASAGVIGVDADGRITILNRSAQQLIDCPEADAIGKPLVDIVPELKDIVATAQASAQRLVHGQIVLGRKGGERNVTVRIATEQSADPTHGYVVTLDDITDLVTAQRTSAWADVARRIAHEIKNPLTPIQLSAERLRRKYRNLITEDRGVFEQCTDTIVRQVDDIKRMVDEFSKFARMPKPVMMPEDLADTIRQVVFLMRVGNPDVDFEIQLSEDPLRARFDRRLISQALTNIIKNAAEAIAALPHAAKRHGRIRILAAREGQDIVIDVVDNGIGLPRENRSRLLEPYVTTREKGTGLGLAIVGRILEEHGGRIELHDAAEKFPGEEGAWVRMRFTPEPTVSVAPEPALQKAAE
ncbi:MAG TPA: PAS domain-containing sensor histidine kinase [Xanthobacteraceae bacterium]|nr:PAS domain-containing sensor histidine kinase [Xanthobacteraceae bacterium]